MVMESFGLDAVVGRAPKKKREKLFADKYEYFKNGYVDYEMANGLIQFEVEKTAEDFEMIKEANEATNEYRRKYRPDVFDVPAKNIRMIDQKKIGRDYLKHEGQIAFFTVMGQGAYAVKWEKMIKNLEGIIHELLHFKAHNKIKFEKDNPRSLLSVFSGDKASKYRNGISFMEKGQKKPSFTNMNEAVTERIATKIVWQKMKHLLDPEEVEILKRVAEKAGLWVESFYTVDVEKFRSDQPELDDVTYGDQMQMYKYLLMKMSEKTHESIEDLETLFEEAYFTGRLHKLAGKIDYCFGDGTFSKIASVDRDTVNFTELARFMVNLEIKKDPVTEESGS